MEPQHAVDIGREAVNLALMVAAPILITGLVVGLLVGLVQALTQVQEQTVSFVPKIVLMVVVASLTLPWLIEMMVTYTSDLISGIPSSL
ncbi:MAG: flagellar biosynthesis protein FliQ [Pirellulales bacterium]|nr:flagellar biosynthesis protein FliQ [Pirellulales bacterium]